MKIKLLLISLLLLCSCKTYSLDMTWDFAGQADGFQLCVSEDNVECDELVDMGIDKRSHLMKYTTSNNNLSHLYLSLWAYDSEIKSGVIKLDCVIKELKCYNK